MRKDFISKADGNYERLYHFVRDEFANNEVIDYMTIWHRYFSKTKDHMNGEYHTHYRKVIDTLLSEGRIRRCSIPSDGITYIVQEPKIAKTDVKELENMK